MTMTMTMRIVAHLLISKIFGEQFGLYINKSKVTEKKQEIKKNIFEIRNKLLLNVIKND